MTEASVVVAKYRSLWEAHSALPTRRGDQPTEVLPGLFLSGHPARFELKGGKLPSHPSKYLLKEYNIRLVINCCASPTWHPFLAEDTESGEITPLPSLPDFEAVCRKVFAVDTQSETALLVKATADTVLKYNVPAIDEEDFDMVPFFTATAPLLAALRSGAGRMGSASWPHHGGVLVHCQAGASRSVSVLASYLMFTYGISAEEAIGFLESKRPHTVNPNPGFRRQLASWCAEYKTVPGALEEVPTGSEETTS